MFPRSKSGGTVSAVRRIVCISIVVAATLAVVPVVAGAPSPFVTAKVSLNQNVKSLVRGRFTQTVTCRDDCSVIARLFIRPGVARKLGFKRVKKNQRYAIALKQVRLSGDRPTKIRMALGKVAKKHVTKKRLKKLKLRTIQVTGETYASATSSDQRGQSSWITTLRR